MVSLERYVSYFSGKTRPLAAFTGPVPITHYHTLYPLPVPPPTHHYPTTPGTPVSATVSMLAWYTGTPRLVNVLKWSTRLLLESTNPTCRPIQALKVHFTVLLVLLNGQF